MKLSSRYFELCPNWLFCSCKYVFVFKTQANKVTEETTKMYSVNIQFKLMFDIFVEMLKDSQKNETDEDCAAFDVMKRSNIIH
jgi:hypothetical protein